MNTNARRVVLFIDAANVYERLKELYCRPPYQMADGQFDPMKLGRLLAARGPADEPWVLSQVRAYTGRPNANLQRSSAAAHARQIAAWRASGVIPCERDLQYIDWPQKPPRQKGVDVELAAHVIRMAGKEYDIAIIASGDTDLVPAIETVYETRGASGSPRVCVVGYAGYPKRLRMRDTRSPALYCFYLSADDYLAIHDPVDYTVT
jgi:uncharacterized LabA/DUF88 family protein